MKTLTPAAFGLYPTHKEHGRNYYVDQFGRFVLRPDAYQDHSRSQACRVTQWVLHDLFTKTSDPPYGSLQALLKAIAKKLRAQS